MTDEAPDSVAVAPAEDEEADIVVEQDEVEDEEGGKGKSKKKRWKKAVNFLAKRAATDIGQSILDEIKQEFNVDLDIDSLESLQKEMLPDLIGHQAFVVQGLTYMMLHEEIWSLVSLRIKISSFLTLVQVLALLLFAYPYQADYLLDNTQLNYYLCFFISFMLTAFEAFFIVVLIIVPIVYGNLQVQVFRKVYLDNASEAAHKKLERTQKPCQFIDKAGVLRLFFFFLSVWINVIPIFGQYVYLKLNERFYLWELFAGYFHLHGVHDLKDQFRIVGQQHIEGDFGASAIFLKTLPLVGPVFALSNSVGAALYAAENEPCMVDEPVEDTV
mmetsp:Transcript_17181/g.19533  ORF Transcript_17181/g.19533 Transcript_17181/m.19533 type:complete len:329 (-) Transcript_17181:773-1759(-)|eukprot:CAMPEP_0184040966 /NCGR_PEP_ID=MMETSP0955-20130417/60375_1 /TAXON_ID=627963 /ORGANISM="Aplanochytrium sp, Strain PBS07" /LENGTH=328 /DNA_ID=CAMNT_0026331025 /DNA_START=95 /DNA_END=1081 /DNA_ORIENTATION=+